MESYIKKEPIDKTHKSTVVEKPVNLESIKYDDKRLQDPLFCKSVAKALEKFLTNEEPSLSNK